MIVLIGHGYVGRYIADELLKQELKFSWIRHTDPIPSKTSVIINAAGFTGIPNVDTCENQKTATFNGNVVFPILLEINNPKIPIVHITSGCVYTGYKDGGWTEEDPPNFTVENGSFYSGTKVMFQQLMKPYLNKSYLLRIRMPFGPDPTQRNLLTKLETYEKLISHANSVSSVEDVARVAVHFATKRPRPGIYNVCNPGGVTIGYIADLLKLDKEWMTPSEFKKITVAPRSNCILNVDKLLNVFPVAHSSDELKRVIERYNGQKIKHC